jgi:hypothetical protein
VTTEAEDGMNSSSRARSPRAIVGCLYLFIVAGLGVGVLAFDTYVVAEHQRLSPWEGVWVWVGEGVALFWATVYFIRHTVLGVPLTGPSGPPRRTWTLWTIAFLSILAGLGTDLWKTRSLRASEREAFGTASRTVGTIHAVKKTYYEQRVGCTLHCSYADSNQVVHHTDFYVRDPDELPNLPPGVVQAVRAEQFPVDVTIAYDGDRPKRSWLADLGWKSKTRLYGFSLLVLLFQAIAAVVFLMMLTAARVGTGRLPWWYDLHATVLVAVQAGVVLLFGGLGMLLDQPVFWGDGEGQ